MLETIIGKKVRIIWTNQSGSADGKFEVRGLNPNIQWICLQGINELGERVGNLSWTRFSDIDQIEVLDSDYNPTQAMEQFKALGNIEIQQGASGIRASLHFDLPKAEEDFYLATHASNAFGALIVIGEKFKKDIKNPDKYQSVNEAIEQLHVFFRTVLDKSGVSIEY